MRIVYTAVLLSTAALAQDTTPARAGVVHYTEGEVTLNGLSAERKMGKIPIMAKGDTLATGEGRVEVLLAPGSFLRLGEESAMRLHNGEFGSIDIEMVKGSAVVETGESTKEYNIRFRMKDGLIAVRKTGIYRLEVEAGLLKVHGGEALVTFEGSAPIPVKAGRMLAFDGSRALVKFDPETGDPLFRWARRRASYISMANISASRSMYNSGYAIRSSTWFWNPYFGMYTFVPMNGVFLSPFGYRWYSPRSVMRIYERPMIYAGGGVGDQRGFSTSYNPSYGYNTVTSRSDAGYVSSAPSVSGPAAASSAPVAAPRGGDGGGGRAGGESAGGGRSQ